MSPALNLPEVSEGAPDVTEPPRSDERNLPRPLKELAFLLSAVLSPYIVIPVGTLLIIYARTYGSQFWLWASLSIIFSTGIPALFVVGSMRLGKITDVHVMEREQRGAPFVVAIISNIAAAGLLKAMGAPPSIWGLSLIVAVNGLVLSYITSFYKISMHVAVLSAVTFAAVVLNPGFNLLYVAWLIPALMWARNARGRHSVWQGISGCVVATVITGITLLALPLGNRVPQFIQSISEEAKKKQP